MEDMTLEHPHLDDYFDTPEGEWPERVRGHLAECSRCREELAGLTRLRTLARELPREIQPPSNLWCGIAAEITGEGRLPTSGVLPIRSRSLRRPMEWGWRSLATAAAILVLITAGTTGLLLRGWSPGGARPVASAAPANAGAVGLAAFASTEAEYLSTVEALEAELEARRTDLSPETVAIVEQNLAIIDGAIAESRRALAADPNSADLPLHLAAVYRQKVELLSHAVQISRS